MEINSVTLPICVIASAFDRRILLGFGITTLFRFRLIPLLTTSGFCFGVCFGGCHLVLILGVVLRFVICTGLDGGGGNTGS